MNKYTLDPFLVYRHSLDDKTFFIDIDLDYYRELYNEWDFSPSNNRDLDEDLLEYLSDCCEDIPWKYKLAIIFNLPVAVREEDKEQRATDSIRSFIRYLIRREYASGRKKLRKVAIYALVGVFLFAGAYLLEPYRNVAVPFNILSEGLVVGAWVSFWEVFSVAFFGLSESWQRLSVLGRLLESEIIYNYREKVSTRD
jgi:hypothetical protein